MLALRVLCLSSFALMAFSVEFLQAFDELAQQYSDAESALARSSDVPRLVLDTNVMLDLIYWHDPSVAALAQSLQAKRLLALRSRPTMLELFDVLCRTNFAGSTSAAAPYMKEAYRLTEPIPLALELTLAAGQSSSTPRCRDADDQKFLELTVQAGAQALLSKDKLVLKAGKRLRHQGITVCRPDVFFTQMPLHRA